MALTGDDLLMVVPAHSVPGPPQGYWTYQDYTALPNDGRRYEIMDGVLLIAPSPNPPHQGASMRLSFHLYQCIEALGLGRVFCAPLDVELAPNRVVQPDILVLLHANLHKIKETRIVGAPDLVVEIASPSTATYDRLSKTLAYAQAGVKEYWLVYPEARSAECLFLQGDTYQSIGTFQGQNTLPSQVVPCMRTVQVDQFFA